MRTMASPTEALTTVSAVDVLSLALAEGRGGRMRSCRRRTATRPKQQRPFNGRPAAKINGIHVGPFPK